MLLYLNGEYDTKEVLPGYSALIKKEYRSSSVLCMICSSLMGHL